MRFQTVWSRRWFSKLDLWLAQDTVSLSLYKILHLMQLRHVVPWYKYFQFWWVWQDYGKHSYGKGVMAFGVQLQSMLQVSCLAAVFNADPSQLFPADVFWWMAVPLVGTVNTQMFQAARAACWLSLTISLQKYSVNTLTQYTSPVQGTLAF